VFGPLSAPKATPTRPDLRTSDQRRAEAHHIIRWVDGGKTNLLNAALLCGRRQTIAHQPGWTATTTTKEVT